MKCNDWHSSIFSIVCWVPSVASCYRMKQYEKCGITSVHDYYIFAAFNYSHATCNHSFLGLAPGSVYCLGLVILRVFVITLPEQKIRFTRRLVESSGLASEKQL